MQRFAVPVLAGTILTALLMAPACSMFTEPPEEDEPIFAPGEYGGDPLPGTEHLYNVVPSPTGDRFALIRAQTSDKPSDPRNQLWIVNQDGSNPDLIGVSIGTVNWSPNGDTLAVTVASGIDSFIYTIDLTTGDTTQWSGNENYFFSKPTAGLPIWFQTGKKLLVSVSQKAYQQPFERGIYAINTQTKSVSGPLAVLMEAAYLGNHDHYAIGQKYTYEDNELSGNFARYDFSDSTWHWITSFSKDSLRHVEPPTPSPTSELIVQSREIQNAEQLFLMNKKGKAVRQITELGGDNPRWGHNGSSFIFRRDVHKGKGARYVPHRFDLEAMEAEPLWPALPDSVPDFPPLSTQTLSQTLTPR
jgi:Tol biopolymer transport system component